MSAARTGTDEAQFARSFARHVATLTRYTAPDGRTLDVLDWREPGTGYYALRFVFDRGTLSVSGDMDDAIYTVYGMREEATPALWWAGCDLHYFASKCVASTYGRGFKTWDAEEARRSLAEAFEEEGNVAAREAWAEFPSWEREEATESLDAWNAFLRENGSAIWGENWTDCEPWTFGEVIASGCHAHLYALKRAAEQIKAGAR